MNVTEILVCGAVALVVMHVLEAMQAAGMDKVDAAKTLGLDTAEMGRLRGDLVTAGIIDKDNDK